MRAGSQSLPAHQINQEVAKPKRTILLTNGALILTYQCVTEIEHNFNATGLPREWTVVSLRGSGGARVRVYARLGRDATTAELAQAARGVALASQLFLTDV